jgi:sortase A
MKTLASREVALGVECAWPPGVALFAPRRKSRLRRRLRFAVAAALLALGVWQLGNGVWIQAKAWLAQALMVRAWERTLAGERQVKPWPWADTWPVARLSVPGLGVERYVLAGSEGATIAFGPGHVLGTALPGAPGNSVVGGHRDTHLAFLRELRVGSPIEVEAQDGARRRYAVREARVLDHREIWIAKQEGPTRLTLVTCWPFDAVRAGGPLRYVVWAYAIDGTARGDGRGNGERTLGPNAR